MNMRCEAMNAMFYEKLSSLRSRNQRVGWMLALGTIFYIMAVIAFIVVY